MRGAIVRAWRRPWLRRGLALLALPLLLWGALELLCPFPRARWESWRRQHEGLRLLDREGQPLREFAGPAGDRMLWVELDRVSPWLIRATIAAEDQHFAWHPGLDPLAVLRAGRDNLAAGRRVSGASTLTMQTMRLLDPAPRTWRSKLRESWRALQAELRFSKRELLTRYLNLAPYGANLRGVEAAAQAWFGRPAAELSLGQAALLAGLPQAPTRLRPDRNPEGARRRRDYVLRRLWERGEISLGEFRLARAEPLPAVCRREARSAPHFAEYVRASRGAAGTLRSTLDAACQAAAEAALRDGLRVLHADARLNGAVVVLDNRDGAILALAGARDYDAAPAECGRMNLALARRSPGSALKPLLYALALERGRLTGPDTVLADIPVSFAGYTPHNYDRRCRGLVPAGEALRQSLNVPAVRLLREVGVGSFHQFLAAAGCGGLARQPSHYGLSLALGGVEVNLLELTAAYGALANGGQWRSPRLLPDDPPAAPHRLCGPGAAWLTLDMLRDRSRLDPAVSPLAWKTGTSYGHRDAWTVAVEPRYTVGVWLGNPRGGAIHVPGVEAAAPVALRLLAELTRERPAPWFARPDEVLERPLCAGSGQLAGPDCPQARPGYCLQGRLPAWTCRVHRRLPLDRATGLVLTREQAARRPHDLAVRESWPAAWAEWLRQAAPRPELAPPTYREELVEAPAGARPRIESPAPGRTYYRNEGALPALLPLRASSEGACYWFVDGMLFRRSAGGEEVYWPMASGSHRIVCAGEDGQGPAVQVVVR